MPITRRRRANPPDQPENNHHQPVDQTEGAVEQPLNAEAAPAPSIAEPEAPAETPAPATPAEASAEAAPAPTEQVPPAPTPAPTPAPAPAAQPGPALAASNGDRPSPEYTPTIEGGRRTARGELFRRPPQVPPPQPQASFVSSAPLQAPTHEITLPLGNLLHLAYNPGYTGSEEARSLLLHRLSEESKAGGRARCWNCGSLAIAYDRWNTRSRSFGDVGIAFCEICGVWSVM
jgi:hypothetical protein